MSEILFINACISTGHPSRTLFLARYFLKQLAKNTQSKITEIDLTKENLQPLNEKKHWLQEQQTLILNNC